jgi:hypothetical protein
VVTDLDVLKRIVALLISLATLAEHAAGRSPERRIFMFGLLRRAGSAAVTLLDDGLDADALRDAGCPQPGPEYVEPADLVRLAAGLRLIAMVILHFRLTPSGRPRAAGLRGLASAACPPSPGFRIVPHIDTS